MMGPARSAAAPLLLLLLPFATFAPAQTAAVEITQSVGTSTEDNICVWCGLPAALGVAHQFGQLTQRRRTTVDSALTWTWRTDHALVP